MVQLKKAEAADLEQVISIRLEMLRAVHELSADHPFDAAFLTSTREHFCRADQTTILALDGEAVIGCASLCYISLMPTFDHPTGKRAHLMNVYTRRDYRRQGIAAKMVRLLLEEARERGVTEISLDATQQGRPLYLACGFAPSQEGMVLNLFPQGQNSP